MAIALSPQRQFVYWQIYPIEIIADKHKTVYSSTGWINPKSRKALWVRHEQGQVTLYKWKERLSGSSKGRVDPSIDKRPRGMVGERPWTDELLPHIGHVWPRGVQRLPIPHKVGGQLD